ncbi:hypothetical protein DYB32_001356 [Aphanomyces invadans]|uniref:Uncharacterized protein n=1 Tax=Aphanomyces invadans TaxID=157072 RepID=A0A418B6R2_9STRA|nr:hypothetical protein DYB32_001356 [Aphanomyces invadans]
MSCHSASTLGDVSVDRHVGVNKFERKLKWLSKEEHYRVRISRYAVTHATFVPDDVWTVEICCALFFLTDLVSRGILLAESFKSMLCWNTFINFMVIFPVYPAAMFVPTQYDSFEILSIMAT